MRIPAPLSQSRGQGRTEKTTGSQQSLRGCFKRRKPSFPGSLWEGRAAPARPRRRASAGCGDGESAREPGQVGRVRGRAPSAGRSPRVSRAREAASEDQRQLPREEAAPSRRGTGRGCGRGLPGRGLKTSLPAPLHFLVREGAEIGASRRKEKG